MCNLQSNLKLNERKRGNSSDSAGVGGTEGDFAESKGREIVKDKGGDRAITAKKETQR